MISFKSYITENYISGIDVADEQLIDGGGLDTSDRLKKYELVELNIKDIKIHPLYKLTDLNINTWQDYMFDGFDLEDEDVISDIEYDKGQILMLMDRYNHNKVVYPIVVTEDNFLVDGYHRIAAFNSLGIQSVKAYKELK